MTNTANFDILVLTNKTCYQERRYLYENFKELTLNELDFMYDSNNALDEYELRIFLSMTKEIKVVYNKEFGIYHNVVELFNGTQIAIEL